VSNQEVWQVSEAIEGALPFRLLAKATAFRNVVFLLDGSAKEKNQGVELFLRRDFTERLGGFVSYTLSRADRETPEGSALSTFDRTHVLSVVLGYDFGAGYRMGGRLLVQSGRPYEVACPTPDCSGTTAPPTSFADRATAQRAWEAWTRSQEALRRGDWATYGSEQKRLEDALRSLAESRR